MVYGTLLFVGERMTNDRRAGQSRAAFTLFGIGLLNSFTNSAHHTYHLPQDALIKWIAFVVSMLELIILWSLLADIVRKVGTRRPHYRQFSASTHLFALSKHWNAFLLPVALLISIPPLNALIHGTHVVMAHAMGSELAIDSYILLGAFAWLFARSFPKREAVRDVINGPRVRHYIGWLNRTLMVLIASLLIRGLGVGVTRYLGHPEPEWLGVFPAVFVISGVAVGYSLLNLILCWLPLLREPLRHRLFRDDPRWTDSTSPFLEKRRRYR